VRSDATARGGVTDHYVIKARVGQEREAMQQLARFATGVVDTLHKQSPVLIWQIAKNPGRKRSKQDFVPAILRDHETRFTCLVPGQGDQPAQTQQILEVGDCAAYEQWLFLPITLQESRWGEAAQ
jgi:hypothetical protein